MHRVWRLSEDSDDNLGLACTERGLVLGRTPLVEQRDGRFVIRDASEVGRLFSRAYPATVALDRLMHGLANVAAALNANDPCLAHIAAVHLRIPDLPDRAARDALEAEDRLIKYASGEDWDPALHPRTGTPPNPGWFAATDGSDAGSSPIRTAQNDDPNRTSDVSPSAGDDWVRLRPAQRIDELADFAEWLANAQPVDERAIRAEIKRYFADVNWESAAHDLNNKLSVILRPGVTREIRQKILNSIDVYTRADPAEYVGTRDALNTAILAAAGLLGGGAAADEPSPLWKLTPTTRGRMIHVRFGDRTFPDNYPIIDKIPGGVATSIKSIDLNAATYQKERILENRVENYVAKVRDFNGYDWGGKEVDESEITGRAVQLIIPKGGMTEAQRIVIDRVRARAMRDNQRPVDIILTEF